MTQTVKNEHIEINGTRAVLSVFKWFKPQNRIKKWNKVQAKKCVEIKITFIYNNVNKIYRKNRSERKIQLI